VEKWLALGMGKKNPLPPKKKKKNPTPPPYPKKKKKPLQNTTTWKKMLREGTYQGKIQR